MTVPAKRRSECPISFALDLFGDRWTLLVIRDMAMQGRKHFGDFLNSGEGIATNILSDRLARLESAGIVTSAPDPGNRRKKIYHLTDRGLDLIPVLLSMVRWGADHDDSSPVSNEFRARLDSEFETMVRDIRARAKGLE